VTGLLARHRGVAAAETFLHASGGVPLYLACAGLLLLLIGWLGRRTGRSMVANWGLSWRASDSPARLLWRLPPSPPLWSAALLIAALLLLSLLVSRPELQVPERQRFAFFPRQLGDWQGRSMDVDPVALASLKLADHLSLIWQRPTDPLPVSLWVAWYDTQVYGASIHSPMACLPGAGWRVETVQRYRLPDAGGASAGLAVNRAILALGNRRQLVYYWFAQRGRELTSEYLLKWYIFQDGLLMQRSDGALIRITTPLPDLADTAAADARLGALVKAITPVLGPYVPGAEVAPRNRMLNKP
jgi:EpsI family protein